MRLEPNPSESLSLLSSWEPLSSDVTELILGGLPIRSIVRAGAVCKHWRRIISSAAFSSRVSAAKKPWFFLCGQNNISPNKNKTFAFDPEADEWLLLPPSLFPSTSDVQSFVGCGGFFFTTSPCSNAGLGYSPILKCSWRKTSPLRFSRCNPLVGVFVDQSEGHRFIVVGGVRFIGGLVDIEDRLSVEIYAPRSDSWELCPPLPSAFRPGNSSQSLSSAMFKGKFYVFGIYSCFVSAFDLNTRCWSEVHTLRPQGAISSFLIACKDQLVLATLCSSSQSGGPSVILWKVDEQAMQLSELSVMPKELLYCLFDSEEDDRFASLKCVGLGNLIYVFNEEHHKLYPACVCEIGGGGGSGSDGCLWRKVPPLPLPVNSFHKVISFCSTISLENIVEGEG